MPLDEADVGVAVREHEFWLYCWICACSAGDEQLYPPRLGVVLSIACMAEPPIAFTCGHSGCCPLHWDAPSARKVLAVDTRCAGYGRSRRLIREWKCRVVGDWMGSNRWPLIMLVGDWESYDTIGVDAVLMQGSWVGFALEKPCCCACC